MNMYPQPHSVLVLDNMSPDLNLIEMVWNVVLGQMNKMTMEIAAGSVGQFDEADLVNILYTMMMSIESYTRVGLTTLTY
eukprot:m51a1_g10806 hypothetical protein (79) ;mRNA; r:42630-43014